MSGERMSEIIDFCNHDEAPEWFKKVVLNLPKDALFDVVSADDYNKSELKVDIIINDTAITIGEFNELLDSFIRRSVNMLSQELTSKHEQLDYERNTFDDIVNAEVARRLMQISERIANGELTGTENDKSIA
jgi:hypothetical protein